MKLVYLMFGLYAAYAVGCVGLLAFAVWVVVKLLQHFGVI